LLHPRHRRRRAKVNWRRYLPWSGEFVGKYLISAVQDLRMSRNGLLASTVADLVDNLITFQVNDGYLGPFDG
jgi:DUF1680 family protein